MMANAVRAASEARTHVVLTAGRARPARTGSGVRGRGSSRTQRRQAVDGAIRTADRQVSSIAALAEPAEEAHVPLHLQATLERSAAKIPCIARRITASVTFVDLLSGSRCGREGPRAEDARPPAWRPLSASSASISSPASAATPRSACSKMRAPRSRLTATTVPLAGHADEVRQRARDAEREVRAGRDASRRTRRRARRASRGRPRPAGARRRGARRSARPGAGRARSPSPAPAPTATTAVGAGRAQQRVDAPGGERVSSMNSHARRAGSAAAAARASGARRRRGRQLGAVADALAQVGQRDLGVVRRRSRARGGGRRRSPRRAAAARRSRRCGRRASRRPSSSW